MMDNLDKQLHQLSKIEPNEGYIEAAKTRIMHRIALQNHESWFRSVLRKLDTLSISDEFITQARLRLMARIERQPEPARLRGWANFFSLAKKTIASTLIMMIAVTSTLFFIEGKTTVEASDDSYLEIISGSASVKHPDLLVWDQINGQIEVSAGDLIKVGDSSEAVIRFFDDTELRLGENALLLISKLTVSPTFDRQAIIEVSLNQGAAWVQTLNVDDGAAGFTLYTRDAEIKALNATFAVATKLNTPTSVQVHSNKVELTSLIPESRQMVETIKLAVNQKTDIHLTDSKPVLVTDALKEQDLASAWIQANQSRDRQHLAALRERGIDRLAEMAGTLPGNMLYPIKQVKERLQLALNGSADINLQIEIANRRLNEALVLFEEGEEVMAKEALAAYQDMARQVIEIKGREEAPKLAHKLITPHQKVFKAELPNDATASLVKEVLQETAESLAQTPIEKEQIRLTNAVERLQDVTDLVQTGDWDSAKERLAKHEEPLALDEALGAMEQESLQKILELRQEELALLDTLSKKLPQEAEPAPGGLQDLTTLVESASKEAKENLEMTLAAAKPFLPEDVVTSAPPLAAQLSAKEIRLAQLVDKITIYKSWTGQKNQIDRLLKNELENFNHIDTLRQVRNRLQGRAYDYLNVRILQLQAKSELQKHKAMERKIERSMRLREE